MSIIPTIIVAGVSLLFVAVAVTPMIVEMLPRRHNRPELTVLDGGSAGATGIQRSQAA